MKERPRLWKQQKEREWVSCSDSTIGPKEEKQEERHGSNGIPVNSV